MTKKIILFALLTYLCLAQNAMLRDMVSADMMKKMEMDMTMENMEPMAIKNTDNFDMTDIEMMPRQNMAIKMAGDSAVTSIEAISNEMAKSAYLQIKPKFNTYNLATNFFNSQRYFGDVCNRCKKLDYFAFRMGNRYLTANAGNLQWSVATSPANTQLFTAEQQIDGTWAFKSLTQGKYISADSNGSTINWRTFVGPWERWYIERHGSHVHIQSAQFQFFYWVNSGSVLRQFRGGASAMIVEHWPAINWLWNW